MIHVLTLCARIMQMTSICLFKLTFIGYCKSFFFGKYSVKVVKHKTFFSNFNQTTLKKFSDEIIKPIYILNKFVLKETTRKQY